MSVNSAGRYLTVWLGLVGIAISTSNFVGCSGRDAGSPTKDARSVDEIVLSLAPGASLEDVKASLGEPVTESTYGGEVSLIYPPWHLYFAKGELRERVREARSGTTTQPGPVLDSKVLTRLVPGMTVRTVKKILGRPEVYEQIYKLDQKPTVVLRYAYWELYLRKGRLIRRTQN